MKRKASTLLGLSVILAAVLLFITMSLLSFLSISEMQGNARVINYVGIVRGATQKLVKEELMGFPDDALIARLDSIVGELITGIGPNDLIVLQDGDYLANMEEVRTQWRQVKDHITVVREGGDPMALYELSQEYFSLVDRTVSSAELFAEKQVNRTLRMLGVVSIVFVLMALAGLVYYLRMAAIRRRAELLDQIAFVDGLTGLPNRISCDRVIQEHMASPPASGQVAVLLFHIASFQAVNEALGHSKGDEMIVAFAQALCAEAPLGGFVGRYNSSELLVVLDDAGEQAVESYLSRVRDRVVEYNRQRSDQLEQISFAAGTAVDTLRQWSIEAMLLEAERRMRSRERQMRSIA